MQLEWDESKRLSNLQKHGFDFNDALEVMEGLTFTVEDDGDYDELRYVSLGVLRGVVVYIVHTPRRSAQRIISMRKATKNETNTFYQEIGNGLEKD
jgi:uncharacterized protein